MVLESLHISSLKKLFILVLTQVAWGMGIRRGRQIRQEGEKGIRRLHIHILLHCLARNSQKNCQIWVTTFAIV
ncbi:hypothetical protein P152DRAFT_454842 [Eremomyces bilateralis CBS 781.70]|uniref:Uncharacterized protein n=1 Tax=Eremomyces bilateralis CBS 781.70 TaxID=1392243 RepID=A0A6G1GEV4_9PEZI|nr:uncharacterized protein P152DRAFT_454842 [Eremomyces bilateralis CBS 781.70]KAF1816607.1 hypothetical protein P152DRAFT_454842 [Eremomyces bilateralis CBS 781.70]